MWNSFAECKSPLNLMNIFTYLFFANSSLPCHITWPKRIQKGVCYSDTAIQPSHVPVLSCLQTAYNRSQRRCQTPGIFTRASATKPLLFVQRNWPHTTTLEARHQNYDMIGYSKAPFCVYMNPTLAKTKWWKNQPKRSSLRTLDVVMELFQSNLWVRTSPLNFDSFSSLHFFNAVHRNLRAETHPPGRCSIYKQNFLEELLPPSHWWVALI